MNIIPYNPNLNLEQYERAVILAAFRFHRGNRTAIAKSLGITTKTLYNKLKGYIEKNSDLDIELGPPEEEAKHDSKAKGK